MKVQKICLKGICILMVKAGILVYTEINAMYNDLRQRQVTYYQGPNFLDVTSQ